MEAESDRRTKTSVTLITCPSERCRTGQKPGHTGEEPQRRLSRSCAKCLSKAIWSTYCLSGSLCSVHLDHDSNVPSSCGNFVTPRVVINSSDLGRVRFSHSDANVPHRPVSLEAISPSATGTFSTTESSECISLTSIAKLSSQAVFSSRRFGNSLSCSFHETARVELLIQLVLLEADKSAEPPSDEKSNTLGPFGSNTFYKFMTARKAPVTMLDCCCCCWRCCCRCRCRTGHGAKYVHVPPHILRALASLLHSASCPSFHANQHRFQYIRLCHQYAQNSHHRPASASSSSYNQRCRRDEDRLPHSQRCCPSAVCPHAFVPSETATGKEVASLFFVPRLRSSLLSQRCCLKRCAANTAGQLAIKLDVIVLSPNFTQPLPLLPSS